MAQMTKNWCETDSKALDRKEYYQERRLKELQLDLPWEASTLRIYARMIVPPMKKERIIVFQGHQLTEYGL